jgi:Protein of unknown function (DUF3455)
LAAQQGCRRRSAFVKKIFVRDAILGSLFAGLAACGGASTVKPADLPASLRVPEGQVLTRQFHAVGVQIYVCQAAKSDATQFEWAFKAPEADLFASAHRQAGKHFAGPSWQANDGSTVVGSLVAKETIDSTAIPWLLLSAKSTSGHGVFTDVKSIQRLRTIGGNAPTNGCSSSQVGQELRTSYSADYLFFR